MKLLDNKVAIITGASRGIGKSIAATFASHGSTLILCAYKQESLESLRDEFVEAYGIKVDTFYFDVSDPQAVKSFYQKIISVHQKIDILVNNAGILEGALVGMITQDQMDRIFQTNAYGVLYLSQYASRMMSRQKSGNIINISSIIGTRGHEGQSVYAGSKAAVIGITLSLSKELAPFNIRVNAIAPGMIATDMIKSLPADKYQQSLASVKLNRIGTPQDVANAALFLASDLSSYVTGQVLGVDGGMMI